MSASAPIYRVLNSPMETLPVVIRLRGNSTSNTRTRRVLGRPGHVTTPLARRRWEPSSRLPFSVQSVQCRRRAAFGHRAWSRYENRRSAATLASRKASQGRREDTRLLRGRSLCVVSRVAGCLRAQRWHRLAELALASPGFDERSVSSARFNVLRRVETK